MNIASANAAGLHVNQHVMRPDRGLGNVAKMQIADLF
jgi:hypothetical protein